MQINTPSQSSPTQERPARYSHYDQDKHIWTIICKTKDKTKLLFRVCQLWRELFRAFGATKSVVSHIQKLITHLFNLNLREPRVLRLLQLWWVVSGNSYYNLNCSKIRTTVPPEKRGLAVILKIVSDVRRSYATSSIWLFSWLNARPAGGVHSSIGLGERKNCRTSLAFLYW